MRGCSLGVRLRSEAGQGRTSRAGAGRLAEPRLVWDEPAGSEVVGAGRSTLRR